MIGPPRFAGVLFELGFGLVRAALADEEVLLRHRCILKVAAEQSFEFVRSLFGHRIDDRAVRAAELGIVLACDDLEFLNGVKRRTRLRAGALSDDVIVVVAAVEHVVVVARVLSVDAHRVRAERFRADARYDAWKQSDEADENCG